MSSKFLMFPQVFQNSQVGMSRYTKEVLKGHRVNRGCVWGRNYEAVPLLHYLHFQLSEFLAEPMYLPRCAYISCNQKKPSAQVENLLNFCSLQGKPFGSLSGNVHDMDIFC